MFLRIFNRSPFWFQWVYYHSRSDQLTKMGMILENMISDKDKKKNWHLNILNNKAKCRNVFEKVHKPRRRRSVLNSLFIKNITDVISTGEIVPEIMGYGIEITGVKISPCCKILNVFWQVHTRHFESSEYIVRLLTIAAPKIRAELISRNVLGHVPHIYFLRDSTNMMIAAFDEAMAKLDLPSNAESAIVPDDSFTKDIYSFKTSTVKKEGADTAALTTGTKNISPCPENPSDMKSDVFGLNRDAMLEKIVASKKKVKQVQQSAIITQEMLETGDLFSKIPGVCFEADNTREKILKQFQVGRKMLMKNKTASKLSGDDFQDNYENQEDYIESEQNSHEEDYVEEDITNDSKL